MDVGSNPAQGEFSFKRLFSLKNDYLGWAGSGFLIFGIQILMYMSLSCHVNNDLVDFSFP